MRRKRNSLFFLEKRRRKKRFNKLFSMSKQLIKNFKTRKNTVILLYLSRCEIFLNSSIKITCFSPSLFIQLPSRVSLTKEITERTPTDSYPKYNHDKFQGHLEL